MLDHLKPKAVLFDFYGTLADIETDEYEESSWRVVSGFLHYRGSRDSAEVLREKYRHYVKESLLKSREDHPDVDVVPIFQQIIEEAGVAQSNGLATTVAQLFRSRSIKRFNLFHEAAQVVDALARKHFALGLVTDSQEPYLLPELRQVNLQQYFSVVVMSSRHGFRKPDPRLMRLALEQLGVAAEDAVYVGDSWTRDVEGAHAVGMHPVWVRREKTAIPPHPDFHVDIIRDLEPLKELQPPT